MHIININYNEIVQKTIFYKSFFNEIKNYLIIIQWKNINLITFQKKYARLKIVYKNIKSFLSKINRFNNINSNIIISHIHIHTTSFNVKKNHVKYTHVAFFNNFINFFANKIHRAFLITIKKQIRRDNEICLYYKKHEYFVNNCFRCFVKLCFVLINFNFFANSTLFSIFNTFQFVRIVKKNV